MSSKIDTALAKNLIQEFQKQNTAPGGPELVTPSGEYIKGFYFERNAIEEALNADSQATGLTVYLAKHPKKVGMKENSFTLVFAGAKPNPQYQEGVNHPYINTSDVYDDNNICPPLPCSSLGEQN